MSSAGNGWSRERAAGVARSGVGGDASVPALSELGGDAFLAALPTIRQITVDLPEATRVALAG